MGSPVRLSLSPGAKPTESIFLGRLQTLDGNTRDYAFYETGANQIHLIPANEIKIENANGTALPANASKPIVLSLNQQGGTCSAYAIYNCLRQMHSWGHAGNGQIESQLATEEMRSGLLARAIVSTYIEPKSPPLGNLFDQFGYKVFEVPRQSAEFKDQIEKYLKFGWPTVLHFDVAKEMSNTPYSILQHSDGSILSNRPWTPTRSRYDVGGRHAVVILGIFENAGKKQYLVSDSNWQAPRLWSESELNNSMTANMNAWVIWQDPQKNPASP